MEETGYQITIGSYIGRADQYHMSFRGEPILGIGHFYHVEILDKLQDPIDKSELTWLDTAQAGKSLFLQNQDWAVRAALEKIK